MNRAPAPALAGLILQSIALAGAVPASALQVETYRPGFEWQSGMRIEATESRVSLQRRPGVSDSSLVSSAAYTVVVSDHPDGLLISHENVRVERDREFAPEVPAGVRVNEVVAENLKVWMRLPNLIVSRSGELIRVDGLEAFQDRVDRSIRPVAHAMAGGDESIPALLDEALDMVVNEAMIETLAADRWSALVQNWIDTEWEVGTVYQADVTAPNPLLPEGAAIPFTVHAGVTGTVACESFAGRTCAAFVMVSQPEPAELGEAARLLADSLRTQILEAAGDTADRETLQGMVEALEFEALQMQTRVQLVADPSSLHPVELEERQTRSGTGVGLGESFSFHIEEILTTRFRYPVP